MREANMTVTSKFEIADYLDDPEAMLEYLALAIEDENPDVFIAALGHVAKARGMSQIAELSGLGRESLYKGLKSGSKLRYQTVQKVVNALGFRLSLERNDAA
jgi:probable addiction module antidote protein